MTSSFFTTSDGVRLHYLEVGAEKKGPVVVFLTGWTMAARIFRFQLAELGQAYRCLALDYRGHGESEKVTGGYRVSRFAADVRELLTTCQLQDVVLVGHSAGCAVTWSYLDLYGEDGLRALVFHDQMVARVKRPEWSEEMVQCYGSEVTGEQVLQEAEMVRDPANKERIREFLKQMVTTSCPDELVEEMLEASYMVPREGAAESLLSVSYAFYPDIFPKIQLPTLCVRGEGSHLHAKVMPWIAAQIPQGRVEIIPAELGGSHFAFLENPAAFNSAVAKFIASLP